MTQASEDVGRDPKQLIELAVASRAFYMHVVPSIISAWTSDASCAKVLEAGAMRLCTAGGEALSLAVAKGFHDLQQGKTRLITIYGTSEAGARH